MNQPTTKSPAAAAHPLGAAAGSAIARHDLLLRQMAYKRLQDCPEMQAEAIAKHYASLAHTALQLLHIIEATRYAPPTVDLQHTDYAIESLVKHIQHAHATDFGIPLAWPNGGGSEQTPWPSCVVE